MRGDWEGMLIWRTKGEISKMAVKGPAADDQLSREFGPRYCRAQPASAMVHAIGRSFLI